VVTTDSVEAVRTHEWVSFEDKNETVWLFDVTFMASDWTCIFGRGCPGVLTERAPELGQGCCSYGAHFTETADRERVEDYAALLTDEQWQLKDEADEVGGPIHQDENGAWITRQFEDACIFLNREDFPAGGGCALHLSAVDAGEAPLLRKPDVCWQLPLRLTEHTDENQRTTMTLREWRRPDWGEGGAEFAWWCTEEHEAFIGDTPVYKALRDEIVALVGAEPYAALCEHLTARPSETIVPHPARRTS